MFGLFKGWIGEKKTAVSIWFSLNKSIYHRFHNLIIPSRNGTTQIDHLLISRYGIFIVETKNKKGWIFGSENQSRWTQTIFKNKYYFQNPLKQTYRQKKVLSEFLNLNTSRIFTVVYFVGDCRFKTHLPPNVLNYGLIRYITSHREVLFSDQEVDYLRTKIQDFKSNSNLTKRDHLRSLRARYNSKTICPKCGSKLVIRTARNGSNVGSNFLGCSAYPKCRFTRNL